MISLARTPDRLRRFRQGNAHMPDVALQWAVDGKNTDRKALELMGTFQPGLPYSPGAAGCFLSHLQFWDAVIETGEIGTVFEDDAVIHKHFDHHSMKLARPADWHIILWGFNFNAPMVCDLMPGIAHASVAMDQGELVTNLDRYQRLPICPGLYRLSHAFGTISYSVSPAGARRIKDLILPVRPLTVQVPLLSQPLPNMGVDVALNAAFRHLNAYVCFPPLVVTPNHSGSSTVR